MIRVSLPEPVRDELVYTRVTLTKTDITGQKTLPARPSRSKTNRGKVIYRETTDANGQIPQIPSRRERTRSKRYMPRTAMR